MLGDPEVIRVVLNSSCSSSFGVVEKAIVVNNTLDLRLFEIEISCEIAAEKRKKAPPGVGVDRGGK